MSSRFILPFADVGLGIKPSSGAKLFFFETDGTTPKNTFSDQLSTPTANTNPVIANSNGVFGDIYIEGTYKVTLQDKNGSQIFGLAIVVSTGASGGTIGEFTLADAVANTAAVEGQIVQITDRADGQFEYKTGQSPNTFNIVQCTGVPTLALVLRVTDGKVSTASLGSNKSANDYLVLIHAANHADWNHIIVENYSPSGGEVYVDRLDVEIDFNRNNIDMTGISHPILVLGQKANGDASDTSRYNIIVSNVRSTGDKTAGSRIVRFRNASTCTLRDWRQAGCATAFDGDATPLGPQGYESIACSFENLDLRGNVVGFLDTNGSFQGSTFQGGRIEQNDEEGVYTATPNINFMGTVIEGNDQLNAGRANIRLDGGGGITFVNVYQEARTTSPAVGSIIVDAGSTKRVSIFGGDWFGNNGTFPRRLVNGSDWVTGNLTVSGVNMSDYEGFVVRGGSVGNWMATLDGWSNVPVEDANSQVNGSNVIQGDRVQGMLVDKLTAVSRVCAENLQVQETGSAGFSREFQRFIGQVSVGGAGDWHQVIDLTDVGAAASTGIRFDLYFFERGGDFQFYTTIMLNGTTTLKTKEDVSGNWSNSLYRINAGFLEVDNLPAANRDWTCRVVATKGALT